MEPEPRDWEHLNGKTMWPDRAIYNPKPDGTFELVLIIDKGNNRALTADRAMMVRLLESVGVNVKLAYGGYLMTLDEFNNGAGYRTVVGNRSMQQVYNARTELKNLELLLERTPPTDIAYNQLLTQIAGKRRMLDAVAPPAVQQTPIEDYAKKRVDFMASIALLLREIEAKGGTKEEVNAATKEQKDKWKELTGKELY